MSRLGSGAALAAALILWTAPVATAQEWTGAYVAGSVGAAPPHPGRSPELRVGKECRVGGRSRWPAHH